VYIIYKHTCKISGKSYIGYTSKTINKRWKKHLNNSKKMGWKFSKALRKYPDQFWIHEILIYNISALEEAKNLEILCIFYYDTFEHGYNSTRGGDGSLSGWYHSKKSKIKMSESHKGMKFSEEHRQKLSELHTGKKFSEETKRKISLSNIGKHRSDEVRKKLSDSHKGQIPWMKGKKHSKKSLIKMSIAHKRKNINKVKLSC
jgi:group I intron endonuclease